MTAGYESIISMANKLFDLVRTLVIFLGMGVVLAVAPCSGADAPAAKDGGVVLENEALKITVSPIGGRVVSLFDKLHGRENVKILPYIAGMNEIRYSSVLNVKDGSSPFVLSVSRDAQGNQVLKAVARAEPTEELPASAMVTKEYVLVGNSSRVRMALEIVNPAAGPARRDRGQRPVLDVAREGEITGRKNAAGSRHGGCVAEGARLVRQDFPERYR
jgi:hypothetical protein